MKLNTWQTEILWQSQVLTLSCYNVIFKEFLHLEWRGLQKEKCTLNQHINIFTIPIHTCTEPCIWLASLFPPSLALAPVLRSTPSFCPLLPFYLSPLPFPSHLVSQTSRPVERPTFTLVSAGEKVQLVA